MWRNFLQNRVQDYDDVFMNELSDKNMGVRQICNLIATAEALAEHRGERLSLRHVRQATEAFESFQGSEV